MKIENIDSLIMLNETRNRLLQEKSQYYVEKSLRHLFTEEDLKIRATVHDILLKAINGIDSEIEKL